MLLNYQKKNDLEEDRESERERKNYLIVIKLT